MNIRTNHELRLKTFDFLNEFKDKDYSRQELIEKINKEFGIPKGALYDWYSGRYIPCGRKGSITKNPELFYVIGALLGDGCIYNWKITRNYVILVGDKKFTDKFSKFIGFCTNIKTKSYLLQSEIHQTDLFMEKYSQFKTFLKYFDTTVPIIVFGSFARFTADKNSDLDLLVISKKEINLPFHLLPFKPHRINMSEKIFLKALEEQADLIKEIEENHIILNNHSFYINMMWGQYGK